MTLIDRPDTTTTATVAARVPVAFERDLAEVGVIVVAVDADVAPAVVLPLDVAMRFLQEAHAAQPRRYVTDSDRERMVRATRAARYPDAA